MNRERYLEDYTVGEIVRAETGVTLTESEIIDFAFRYDPQPIHIDKPAAEHSPYGGLIASGWQVAVVAFRTLVEAGALGRGSAGSPGADQVRWHRPVRPGDTITGEVEVTGVRDSRSKPDRGVVTMDWRVTNQRGERVMSWQGTQIVMKRQ